MERNQIFAKLRNKMTTQFRRIGNSNSVSDVRPINSYPVSGARSRNSDHVGGARSRNSEPVNNARCRKSASASDVQFRNSNSFSDVEFGHSKLFSDEQSNNHNPVQSNIRIIVSSPQSDLSSDSDDGIYENVRRTSNSFTSNSVSDVRISVSSAPYNFSNKSSESDDGINDVSLRNAYYVNNERLGNNTRDIRINVSQAPYSISHLSSDTDERNKCPYNCLGRKKCDQRRKTVDKQQSTTADQDWFRVNKDTRKRMSQTSVSRREINTHLLRSSSAEIGLQSEDKREDISQLEDVGAFFLHFHLKNRRNAVCYTILKDEKEVFDLLNQFARQVLLEAFGFI